MVESKRFSFWTLLQQSKRENFSRHPGREWSHWVYISNRGVYKDVYISHIWEEPLFMQGYDWTPADDAYFAANVFNVLRDGNENTQAISSFIGMDTNLGPLNHIYSPKVFVVTPYTTDFDEARFGITTPLRYQARVEQLAKDIIRTIPGSDFAGSGLALGYVRTDIDMATARGGIASRAIWEADPQQFWLAETNSQGLGVRIGRWRLWVEDRIVAE